MLKQYCLAPLAALALLLAAPRLAQAQAQTTPTGGVGIGTTAPDASAALDIVSSGKGVLLPRVVDATAIASPAPGLLVYQTGGTAGFYYNAGTAAAPSWQQLATAGSGGTTTGDNLGNHTATTNLGLNGNWLSNAPGNANGLRIDNNGNVGVGTSSPAGPLQVNGLRPAAPIVDQEQSIATSGFYGSGFYQTFTAGRSQNLVQVYIGVSSYMNPQFTFNVYQGAGTGGTLLSTQLYTFGTSNSYPTVVLPVPVPLVSGQVYTMQVQAINSGTIYYVYNQNNPYAGGEAVLAGGSSGSGYDMLFRTYTASTGGQSLPVLTVLNSGNVGIGTTSATQPLEVAGVVYSNAGGFQFPDGTVQTTAGLVGSSAILNQGSQQTNASFNIDGNGSVGGRLGIGTSSPAGQLANTASNVLGTDGNGISSQGLGWASTSASGYAGVFYNARPATDGNGLAVKVANTGAVALDVSQGNGAATAGTPLLRVNGTGNVGIGTAPSQKLEVAGSVKISGSGSGLTFPDNTVQTTALSSSSAILNQTARQASASFNISGSGAIGGDGYVGGNLGLGIAPASTERLALQNGNVQLYATTGAVGVGISNTINGASSSLNLGLAANAGEYSTLAQRGDAVLRSNGKRLILAGRDGGSVLVSTGPIGSEAERLRVLPGSNVGIGTSSPGEKLDVAGNTNVSGNATTGGNGYVGGSVGIGTTSPSQKLDVNGGILARASGAISQQGAYLQCNRTGGQGETWLLNQQGLGPGGIFFGKSDQSNNATEWARFDSQGNLGIGTSSPIAKLHVSGSASAAPTGGNTSYFFGGSPLIGPQPPGGTTARPTAAYFDGGQVWVNSTIVAGELNTTSDRRIKHVIGLSDRIADLALLNKLRITDYTYIDQHANTDKVVKKVIAQEVEQVLPAAVSRSTQAIPNVYEKAPHVSHAHGQLTVTTAKPHELPAGGGRMRFYTPANESLDVDVTVVDAHTVRFASAQAYAAGLFVYGKYVDDFRSVDYDALTTLNVSATQELARKVAALEAENAALKAQATADKAQATATLESFEARLRRLEAGSAQAQR